MKNIFLSLTILSLFVVIVSCDKDYNTIGSDIIGEGNYEFNMQPVENIVAYNKATGAVQSNNLPINSLGVYSNPSFGDTKSSFVTQLELSSANPDFGFEPKITENDSVYLYIPFFSKIDVASTGIEANTYIIDSIYGDVNSTFDLKIYQNNYYLNDYDPNNPSVGQKYFSNQRVLVENVSASGQLLNDNSDTSQNSNFKFKADEIIFYKRNSNGAYLDEGGTETIDPNARVIKERLAPGIWINLDKQTFSDKILNAPKGDLLNNNIFKEKFRGLYFQVTKNAGQNGALAQLDFSKGYIKIQYHSKKEINTDVLEKKSYQLNLKGNTINFFDNLFPTDYENALNSSNFITGDNKLYVKGGNGSVAFIDLFGEKNPLTGIPYELERLKANKWLINDAILTFYIDKETLGSEASEPKRIYVYDAINNKPIIDYTFDSSNGSDTKNNKYIYGGQILKENIENGRGIKYSIRLVDYIRNLLSVDTKVEDMSFRLGVSVTESINISDNNTLETGVPNFSQLPQASVLNPLGTILYGSNIPESDSNYEKRLKLEIYYTKPN